MLSLRNGEIIKQKFIVSPRDSTEVSRGYVDTATSNDRAPGYVPGIELVYDALEAYDREEPRGETRNPSEQKNGEGDEGAEASGVRQHGGLHVLGRRPLIRKHDFRISRRRGRR